MGSYIIIGASSGIGEAIASQLLKEGHMVHAVSRENRNNLPNFSRGDVLDQDSLPLIEGPVDGLVYCPGSINLRPFKMLKESDFQTDMNINFMGLVRALKTYLPNIQQAPSASVVLFSTVAVQTGMPFHASIAAAKGAVEAFGVSMAAELAPKIRVNSLAPSLTDTPLAARLLETPAKREAVENRHPAKQIGDPSDIASLACWLLSDRSSFLTGQVIKWDGGISSIRV